MSNLLIADSGSTKADWCLLENGKKKKTIVTQGISPYFLLDHQIVDILNSELLKKLKGHPVDEIHYYGTGCASPDNVRLVKGALRQVFPKTAVRVNHDLLGAARALCGRQRGVACILGTGSNSCYYNGRRIVKNSPGIGFILGDEGSGADMGKKVVQHYLYDTFDADLMDRFNAKYDTTAFDILAAVYKEPLPNRYLAGYAGFLAENRGHFMIENIIEDSFSSFVFNHVYKYRESWTLPIHFVGSVAYGFRDMLKSVCAGFELQIGTIMKQPMDGLIRYHTE
jgi:glucosamine kinase